MSLEAKIQSYKAMEKGKKPELQLTSKLQQIIDDSHVFDLLEELGKITPVELEQKLLLEGKKMVVLVNLNQESGSAAHFTLSITEDSLSFIGNNDTDQYVRLTGEQMQDRELLEDALAQTYNNPTVSPTRG